MALQNIKQIRGASQGSLIFLGTNSVLSEDYNRLNWNQSQNVLSISGQIKISDGTQQSGYFLVSDNNGLATWTESSISITNGIDNIGGSIGLGGTMSRTTVFDGDGYDLFFEGFDNLIFTASVFDVAAEGLISLDAGTGSIQIVADEDISIISLRNDVTIDSNNFVISTTSSSVTTFNQKGLEYAFDYSGTFSTNSLVSKRYVDDRISGLGGVNKYATTITNSSILVDTPITVTHSLGSTDITVAAWDLTDDELMFPRFSNRTTNAVNVTFTSVPVGDIRIVITS